MPRRSTLAWWAVLGAAALVASSDLTLGAGDTEFFVGAGRAFLSPHWRDAYSNPAVQSGPLQLALFGLTRLVPLSALAILLEVAGTWAVVATLRRLLRGRNLPAAPTIVVLGAATLLLDIPREAVLDGHPAQLAIPLLWLVAGMDVRDGRLHRAALLVALSAGFEVWGVLGIAVFALAPRLRPALVGAAAALAGAALLVLPFVAAGGFAMLDYAWRVESRTLASLIVGDGSIFPWSLRVAQAAAALTAGIGVALALRRTTHALPMSLAALVAVRLALDPVSYSWYWAGLQVLTLAAVAELVTSSHARAFWRSRFRSSRRPGMPIETA